MKRIFIAMHYLEIGGAESALIGLLHALDYSKVSVDLFLYAHRGELMDQIPAEVNLLPEIPAYADMESPLKQAILNGHLRVAAGRLRAKVLKFLRRGKITGTGDSHAIFSYIGRCLSSVLPEINDSVYDLAISFLIPHDIVLSKVKAGKKICWIHTDYSRIALDPAFELPVWQAYDNIISISPDVSRGFTRIFPQLKDKIVEIANILPSDLIRRKAYAEEAVGMEPEKLKLLSIGRFSYAKNFDNIPDIARRLRDCHNIRNFHWYVIGYGPDEVLIRNKIKEAGVEDCVSLIGKRSNPYPYIRCCDLYVQPSRYEGRCVTVREAQLLGKAVAIADYPTAPSQVTDGKDGFVLPLANEKFAEGLSRIITDSDRIDAVTANLCRTDYSDRAEADKLLYLI